MTQSKDREAAEKYSREAVEIHNSRPQDSYRDFLAGRQSLREEIEHARREQKCSRCGDMYYDPKTVIRDKQQSAEEWEEIAKAAQAENATLKEREGFYREWAEKMAQILFESFSPMAARNYAAAKREKGVE